MIYRVEEILSKWGHCWAFTRIGTEYPSVTPSMPVIPSIRKKSWLKHLSDDECLKVETAVMKLHDINLIAYQVVMAMYVQGFSEKEIVSYLNISPAKMYRARNQGISFLQGAFSILKIKYLFIS